MIEAIPLIAAVPVIAGSLWLASLSRKFQAGPDPFWPFAQGPGLALELCPNEKVANQILGVPGTTMGDANRRVAAALQKRDFLFILLYVGFLIATASVFAPGPACWPVVASAAITGLFDYWENFRILGILKSKSSPLFPRTIGQLKWWFYFLTLFLEGFFLFGYAASKGDKGLIGSAMSLLPMATAIGGLYSSIKGSFKGVLSASRLSALGLLLLAAAPLILAARFSWHTVAIYAVLSRVPLLTAGILALLPVIAFTRARSLLAGLFDLTPWSLFAVALTTLAAAGAAATSANIVLTQSSSRFGVDPLVPSPEFAIWVGIMFFLSLPIVVSAVVFSVRQRHPFAPCIAGAAGGLILGLGLAFLVHSLSAGGYSSEAPHSKALEAIGLFSGYLQRPGDHVLAFFGWLFTLLVYISMGVYGYSKLGRARTVPALCSALMLVTMLTWMLSGAAFFFDQWRVPVLLIVGAAGFLTAQSDRSDDFYNLTDRFPDPMPPACATLTAAKSPRIIVAAANGGGIQAGAWAAKVLYELHQECEDFGRALRMISSVSGGSVGTAFYVHWLANRKVARRPDEAAAMSSLDEVAWGLGWTDFLRALFPWLFGFFIGRGRAMEKAWLLNAVTDLNDCSLLDQPLSSWNQGVAEGEIPAVVMNATIAETGERLLLSTTAFGSQSPAGKARVDASELHRINGESKDVSIATAARLSATFPYVTPASRSNGAGPQPHVVDGGYYDNYGMATLVEWLDEALTKAKGSIEEVLVLQIHGAPVDENAKSHRHEKTRGWFYQAIAPLTTLAAVRSSGQIAHNNIELELLVQKWNGLGIKVRTEVFEFGNPNAPLSWHLTPDDITAISNAWDRDMGPCREGVKKFLERGESASRGYASSI